ncbi:MAG: thioredoxin family protein [Anaerolineae bacterium]|nr:thioredoxin family protein [Anaerolineae bacterium]
MKEKFIALLKEDGLTLAIVAILIVVYAILRTPGDEFASAAELEAEITNGQPTVIEFYANNCSICLISKPKVDQLERDLGPAAQVLRLNVRNDPGKALASEWGVAGIPTFFVLDGEGQMLYRRSGAPDVAAITETIADLSTLTN